MTDLSLRFAIEGDTDDRPFETHDLLDAVGVIDRLRDFLNDGEGCRPPQLRIDTLNLHQQAMHVLNYKVDPSRTEKFFDDADDIAGQIHEMRDLIARLETIFDRLAAAAPQVADE